MNFERLEGLVASLIESGKETDRRMQETDRLIKELRKSGKETEQFIKDLGKQTGETKQFIKDLGKQTGETSQTIKDLSKQVGGIDRNIGFHAEQYFQNALDESLAFGGEKYDKMIPNLKYHHKNINAEFDIVLVNGKNTALIEVKNRIHPDFVDELAEKKLADFKKYFPEFIKDKVFLGIAGFSFDESVLKDAEERGIGIIRQVGKSIEMSEYSLKPY
jgi:hypothetical protein